VTTNLFINGGRTGQLAFVISIFVLGFYNIQNKVKAFFIMFLLSALIIVTAYSFSQVFKTRVDNGIYQVSRFVNDDENKYNESVGYRLAAWHEAIVTIIPEHPIVGVGMGDEMHVIEENIEKNNYTGVYKSALQWMIQYNYHNAYIQYTVQLGIIGLFLYLFMFYNIFRLNIANKELSNSRYMFILVFCISSLFDVAFTVQFPLALFALFVGVFIGFSNLNEEELV
jgi:O-antigen ligase